jgi:hypothetical protein
MNEHSVSFPLTAEGFLRVISNSFREFLHSGTSRSTAKLKPLHGAIAQDIAQKLGEDYDIFAKGYGRGKEKKISGRYFNKIVDITIHKAGVAVAGIAIKFVMQNYSQNSNNYFENLLGETANIRSAKYPYFQIFVILDKLPHYKKDDDGTKTITSWETFTTRNASKYIALSKDNIETFFHTPNKTLIYVVHIPDNEKITTLDEYMNYYTGLDFQVEVSAMELGQLGNAVIVNDYETFREKVYHTIKAI